MHNVAAVFIMEIITSVSNERVKRIVRLHSAKGRSEEGLFIAEGIKILRDNKEKLVELYVREDKVEEFLPFFPGVPQFVVTDRVYQKLTSTETPQGILGVFRVGEAGPITSQRVLVLSGLQDPGNVGALIRTAVASGFTDILAESSASPYSPKAVRASMGGIFRVNYMTASAEEIISLLDGYSVCALDMGGENLFSAKLSGKIALIVGSEGRGVSPALRSASNRVLALPMLGGIESLNAAVSAGIAMYRLSKFNQED